MLTLHDKASARELQGSAPKSCPGRGNNEAFLGGRGKGDEMLMVLKGTSGEPDSG